MSWLLIQNTLINLRHAKSIYIYQQAKDEEKNRAARWSITVFMFDKEGKYERHFESEAEAHACFEKIKQKLDTIEF